MEETANGIANFEAFLERVSKTNSDPYVAPEILKGHWSIKNDEWSVGVLLHQLLIGQLPYQSDIAPEMFKKIVENRLTNCQSEFEQVSEEATDLLS